MLAALETRPTLPPGLRRGPVFLVLADDAGEIVDTLGEWAGKERYVADELGAGRIRAHRALRGPGQLRASSARTIPWTSPSTGGRTPVTRIRGGYSARAGDGCGEGASGPSASSRCSRKTIRPGWRERLERSTIRDTYPRLRCDRRGRRRQDLDRGLSEAGRRDEAGGRSWSPTARRWRS